MSETPYKIKQEAELVFTFESVGPKGIIEKIVCFDRIGENEFNFGFGDRIENTFEINYNIVTDNGDRNKVLATVIATLPKFFEIFPDATIYFFWK